jgi:hypothetical protein
VLIVNCAVPAAMEVTVNLKMKVFLEQRNYVWSAESPTTKTIYFTEAPRLKPGNVDYNTMFDLFSSVKCLTADWVLVRRSAPLLKQL